MQFQHNDGGRQAAGYTGGPTGDCGVRAIAIATEMGYEAARQLVIDWGKRLRHCTTQSGISTEAMKRIMHELGWRWVATMKIGSGCRVHLTPSELPPGRLIVRVSKHYTTMIDGVVHDTFDPNDRQTFDAMGNLIPAGPRCVYGYWIKADAVPVPATPARRGRPRLVR